MTGWGKAGDRREGRRAADRSACGRRTRSLSARVQRRPAPAHRLGGRARLRAEADRAGRAGLGARRVDPGADDEPPEGHPGPRQRRLSAGGARPRHCAPHGRPHGRHVSRQDRRARAHPSLFDDVRHPYTKALFSAVLLARPASGGGSGAGRRDAVAAQPAERLPIPHALPIGDVAVLRVEPALREVSPGHRVACHLFEEARTVLRWRAQARFGQPLKHHAVTADSAESLVKRKGAKPNGKQHHGRVDRDVSRGRQRVGMRYCGAFHDCLLLRALCRCDAEFPRADRRRRDPRSGGRDGYVAPLRDFPTGAARRRRLPHAERHH